MTDPLTRKTFRIRLDEMITVLRGEIATGKRQPGEFLPSERDLVRQFQLSNKLVRVALDQLVSEGLVVKIPRVGNKVAESSGNRPVSLRFGYHTSLDSEADMATLLAEFHRLHPNIIVQPIPLTYQTYYDTVREYMENNLLDVVTMNYMNFLQFQSKDNLDLFQEHEPDPRLYSFLADIFAHNDNSVVRPFIFSPLILCYNRDHLREVGIEEPFRPASWVQLLDAAKKLTVENERFGLYFFLLSLNRWPVFLLQSGVDLLSDRSNLEVTVERIMDGLNACRDILYADNAFPVFLSESDTVAEELFARGKISMILTSYFALSSLRHTDIPFELAPLPRLRENRTLLMTIGLAICKKSKSKVAAQTLVDFLLSDQSQLLIQQKTLSIPAVRAAAEWSGKDGTYRPSNFHLYRDISDTYRLLTDMNIQPDDLSAIIKEARLFWAKLHNEATTRMQIREILNSSRLPAD